jgi:hypothetical protein
MKGPVIVGGMHRRMRHAWPLVLDLLFLVSFWGSFSGLSWVVESISFRTI